MFLVSNSFTFASLLCIIVTFPDVHILVRCNVYAFGTSYHTVFDSKLPGPPPYSFLVTLKSVNTDEVATTRTVQ